MEREQMQHLFIQYSQANQLERSLDSRLLGTLIEYWARERDHKLSNQLLYELVSHYSASIKVLVDHNTLKNKFLRVAAHDLSGPLSAIKGLSDILLAEVFGPLTDSQREYITTINAASDGILTLVNELLDVSLIESGRLRLSMSKGSLETLLRERVQIQRAIASDKEIVLQEDYFNLPNQTFDHNKIAQAIDNILGNAIKYSPFNSRILIQLERRGDMARISVRDEGPGVSETDRKIIFDEFKKLGTRTTGGEKSTGLGLAIAKRIVEAHRGTIGVTSYVGLGSEFYFELPLEDDNDYEQ